MITEMSQPKELADYVLTAPNGYMVNTMGMAIVNNEGKSTLHNSDNPQRHLQEAQNMRKLLGDYVISNRGTNFVQYLQQKNRKLMPITGVGTADLGDNAVAALVHNGLEGVIVSNYNGKTFETRIQDMAKNYQKYNLTTDAAKEYVINHELTHATGIAKESKVESFLKEYFNYKAKSAKNQEDKLRYGSLFLVAREREQQQYHAENIKYKIN